MFRVARGGANWVLAPLTLAILMVGFSGTLDAPVLIPLSGIPFFAATSMMWFFRDPERRAGNGIVSPADGKVVRIDTVDDPDLGPCDRLAIFMSVLDVHVNRVPAEADIRRITHHPGKHIPAFNKDSDRNERVETLMRTDDGDMKVVQIAGALARRIVPYLDPGDHVEKGVRLGLIRLGSRCDVIIPRGRTAWTVKVGQKVRAGISTVAKEAA